MRILIESLHGLGDMVCTLPMIRLVRQTFPEAYIMVLTKFKSATSILEASRIPVDEIKEFNIYAGIKETFGMLHYLRDKHFDYGICNAVTPVHKANLFMKAVGPAKVLGLQKEGVFFDELHDGYHFVEANLQAVKEICHLPTEKIYPRLFPDADLVGKLRNEIGQRDLSRKVVGICIGEADFSLKNRWLRTGKVYTRSWGIGNMAAIIKKLRQENLTIVLIGGKAEEHLVPYLKEEKLLKNNVINFVGKTSMPESIALASLCDVVFGVDTGMQHIASAVGAKTVSVFGPTNPVTHGAYSSNASFLIKNKCCENQFCYGTKYYVSCPYQRRCLKLISPQDAYDSILECLETKSTNTGK